MVETRQQARRKAHRETQEDNKTKLGIQKPSKVSKASRSKLSNENWERKSLSLEVRRLLENDASEDEFKALLLSRSQDKLEISPPLAFDNIYGKDVFHLAIQKGRLDVLPWMLERETFNAWNVLHLAVVYDNLELVKKLESQIPKLGCALDRSGNTPLHLAFTKCNAQVARFLLESSCWDKYHGIDRGCLGHLAVEALAFDYRKSGMCEWASLVRWLYDKGGMVIHTEDSNGETAIDLATKWDIFDVRVRYTLMGRE